MRSLFIDANVYLRFYAYTDDDLLELEKLHALVGAKQLRIYKNEQLEDEVFRNRENVIISALAIFKKGGPSAQVPRFALHFEESQTLLGLSKQFQAAKSKLSEKIFAEISGSDLRADNSIKQLLDAAEDLPIDTKLLEKARLRQIRGNPPGKQDSIGDQLHWETLLTTASTDPNLHIVSLDNDFSSKFDQAQPNPKIALEWEQNGGESLRVYSSLGAFTKEHFSGISLPSDIIKSSAVSKLIGTTNFENTHSQIAKLHGIFDHLTASDAILLFQAIIDNSQISWIAKDEDVKEFYKKLHEKFLFETTSEMDNELLKVAPYLDIIPF